MKSKTSTHTTGASPGSLHPVVGRLCRAVIKEAVNNGYGDLFDESWNRDAHVDITLTIAELRIAADAINWHPHRHELSAARKARMWRKYIEELDGVE